MAENAGGIFYTVDAKTEGVIDAGRKAVQSLDQLQTAFDRTDRASAKSATAMGKAAKATDDEAAALRKLLGQIDPVIGKTQQLDRWTEQLGRHFDAGRISSNEYNAALAKLDKQYDQLNGSTREVSNTSQGFATRLTPLAGIIAGLISVQKLKQMGELAEQFTLLQSRIQRLSPDLQTATTTYEALLKTAAATGQTLPETVKLWETLSTSLKALGASNDQVVTLTGTLQKIGKIGGSSATETSNALRQLGQALSAGTLRAEEYNSIVEQTPELIRQLASASGMSMGEFRQAMLDGKLSAQQLLDLLLQRIPAVDAEFQKLPRSAADAGNAVAVAFGAALSKLDQALGASQLLAKALDGLAGSINNISGNLSGVEKLNSLLEDQADIQRQIDSQNKRLFGPSKTRLDELTLMQAKLNDQIALQRKSLANTPTAGGSKPAPATTSPDGQKELKRLKDEAEALRAQGLERAQIIAVQKLGAAATAEEIAQAKTLAAEIYKAEQAEKQAKKDKITATTEATKARNAEATAAKKAANEARTGAEQNQKAFQTVGVQLAEVDKSAREVMQDQAALSLNKYATPEQVEAIRAIAAALYDLKQGRQDLAAVDPLAAQQIGFEDELTRLQNLNDAKLLSDQRYLELKGQAERENLEQRRLLEEQNFAAMSKGNAMLISTLNQVQSAGTSALTGLITGASNGQQAVQALGQALLNEVVGSLVQVGVQYVKNLAIQSATGSAATALSVGQAGITAAAWAPAAAAASIGTLGGAAGAGLTAIASVLPSITGLFGGGRKAGGPVNAGTMYRVNEGGAPEVFNAGGQQYMIPNMRGEVVSNRDATNGAAGSGGAGTTVNIHNNNGSNVRTSSKQMDRQEIIDVFIDDYMNGGQTSKAISTGTGTKRRGT